MVAAAISAAASIGGALISSGGAESAANTQAQAANEAAQTQLQMYQQTRKDLQPFMSGGSQAFTQLANLFGFGPGGSGVPNTAAMTQALQNTPGYQFGLNQGQQALDRSAASRGLLLSGAQLKDAQSFGTNYAMQQAWQPYVSQLDWAANLGENAAAGTGQAGATAASNAGTAQLAGGAAAAAGQAQLGNILGQGFTQLASGFGSSYGGFSPNSIDTANMNTSFNPGSFTTPVISDPSFYGG